MSNKKRKVTFDPELHPSSESSPPVLQFAHFPSIVSQQDIKDIQDPRIYKSILKNPPVNGKPYEGLCNFLIDLPPPQEEGLLSLDVLQMETVFKPKYGFGGLKDEPIRLPIFEQDRSSEEESDDDSITEYNINDETLNIGHSVNEDDLVICQTTSKPKTFEASLILEQSPEGRFALDEYEIEVDSSSRPCITEPWLSATNLNASLATLDSDIEFTDVSKVVVTGVQSTPEMEVIIVPEIFVPQTNDLPIATSIDNISNPEASSWPVLNSTSESVVNFEEALDRRKCKDDGFEINIPVVEVLKKIDQFNPNIRKLNEEHDELLDDFEIVNKRNKIFNEIEPIELCSVAAHLTAYNQPDEGTVTVDYEISQKEEDEKIFDQTPMNNVNETSISDDVRTSRKSPSPIEIDPIISAKPESIQTQLSVEIHDTLSVANNANLIQSSISSPLATCATNDRDINITNTVTTESTISDANAQTRRKSSRKIHRKHSHASRASGAIQQQSDINNTNTNISIATSEQKSIDAQAKFKRFLSKMSAKAINENQNVNCAGEPETLEPHMVSRQTP